MDFKSLNNSIIICDNNVKKYIIQNTKFLNATFKTFSEAADDILGYYDDLVYEISKEKNINPYVAENIFDSFRISKEGISDKLDMIYELKNKYNSHLNYVKPINYKKVFVINYYFINNVFNHALSMIDYEMLYINDLNNEKTTLYRANNRFDEVFYVFNKIAELIEKNETDIYIMASGDYNLILKEYSNDFNIDIEFDDSYNLFTLPETMSFINNACGIVKEDIVELINKNNLYRPIINKLNNLNISNLNTRDVMEYLIYLFKTTNIDKDKYTNVIKVTNDIPINARHVFMLGFNQGITPKIYQDTNYISDNEYKKLGLKTSLDMNVHEKKRMTNLIKSIYNVYLSNSKSHDGKTLEQSLFLNELEYEEVKMNYDVIYSKRALEKLTAIMLDDYYKYNDKNELLSKLYNTTKLKYNSYDNSFKGKVDYKLNEASYSKINTYVKCPFQFYLQYVLKLKNLDSENIKIGDYFHKILELCDTEDDVDRVSQEYASQYFDMQKNRNKYIVNNYNTLLKKLINNHIKFNEKTKYTNQKKELEVLIPMDDINFRGKIDLLMKNDNEVMVVDYKTGSVKINLNELEYGINMQLPVYMMFAKHLGYEVNGVFIKRVMSGISIDKDFDEMLYKESRYDGYYIDDLDKISDFYSDLDNSVLNSFKLTKNNVLNKNSLKRALSRDEFDRVMDIAIEKIRENINSINNGKFDINPYRIVNDEGDEKSDSCKYCPYIDVCYRRNKDFRNIEIKKELEIIGRGVDNEVERGTESSD